MSEAPEYQQHARVWRGIGYPDVPGVVRHFNPQGRLRALVVAELHHGPRPMKTLVQAIESSPHQLCIELMRLKNAGLVELVGGGGQQMPLFRLVGRRPAK